MAPHPLKRLHPSLRFRSGDTKIGKIVFPLLVTLATAYITYQLCVVIVSYTGQETIDADLSALNDLAKLATTSVVTAGAGTALTADEVPRTVATTTAVATTRSGGAQVSGNSWAGRAKPEGIHTMCTSNGSPYLNWQTRIMYKTYQKVASQPGSNLKHFTRLLHRRTDDELVIEVPTVRIDSLHGACDRWCDFPVADRPNAVVKWLMTEDSRRGEYIFMIETDYVWMREPPMPAPGGKPVAFHFHYIDPKYPGLHAVINKMWQGDQNKIPCSGPAPVIIKRSDLLKLAPLWEEYTEHIEADADAKEKLGWVREMYAYSIAAAAVGVDHDVQDPKTTVLISQPPADDSLNQASSFHYTWGAQYKDGAGKIVWEFDKRPYVRVDQVRKMKQNGRPTLPPADSAEKGYHLQDGKPVTPALLKVQTQMIGRMQEAIDELVDLPDPGCGWDNEPACTTGCIAGELCVPPGARFTIGVAGA